MKRVFLVFLPLLMLFSCITPVKAIQFPNWVALTFDDGPNPIYTPQILDLLKANGVHATFFVLGRNAMSYPAIVKRESSEGHEIENHTYNHVFLSKVSAEKAKEEVDLGEQTIENITGRFPPFLRPPGGLYNDEVEKIALREGERIVTWSWYQDTRDWKQPGVDKIVQTVLNNLHKGDIILCHDGLGENCSQTVEALKQILSGIKARGYQLVTISTMLSEEE